MDKPRHHPQVIRPWKIQQTQQTKFTAPATGDFRHPHASKFELHGKKQKTTGA
jgi:hypothetical protein